MNFSLPPRKISVNDIICDIEYGIRDLPEVTKDTIKQDYVVVLRKAKPPKSNVNELEIDALKSLNNNMDIVVLKADKGGFVVILDKEDYRKKMLDNLLNSRSYRKLSKGPMKKISKSVALAIKNNISVNSFSHKLTESSPLTPRIYGITKIHKGGAPLRPIVNTIGGLTYLLAKYLAMKLKPLVGNTDSFVKDSASFVNELKDFRPDPYHRGH